MPRIVSDPSQPHQLLVFLRAAGHLLCVTVERRTLRRALGGHDTFFSLCAAVSRNIEHVKDAAWTKYRLTGDPSVNLSLVDLVPFTVWKPNDHQTNPVRGPSFGLLVV